MHGADRGRREIVEDEVTVGGAVDRVGADVLEAELVGDGAAIDLPVDAGQRPGAQRHHPGAVERELEPQHVAAEHPEVGEQVVAEVDRLGPLQVGVARHRPVAVALGQLKQLLHHPPEQLDRPQRVRLDDHRDVGRDLVVAGAPRVQLPGQGPDHLAQAPLDRHVDVLVVGLELELPALHLGPDLLQARVERLQLGRAQHAHRQQRPGMGPRLVDVIRGEAPVELDRAVQPPETGIGRFVESGHGRRLSRLGKDGPAGVNESGGFAA